MSISARGSLWDSLGMALVAKGYFRSWDSSQPRSWTPEKAAPPSLVAGSGSATVAAAMAAEQRRGAALSFRPPERENRLLSQTLSDRSLQKRRRDIRGASPFRNVTLAEEKCVCGCTAWCCLHTSVDKQTTKLHTLDIKKTLASMKCHIVRQRHLLHRMTNRYRGDNTLTPLEGATAFVLPRRHNLPK